MPGELLNSSSNNIVVVLNWNEELKHLALTK